MAYQNFYTTKLYTDVSAADTTITLETPPTATSGRLVLEARNVSKREVIKYTGVSGNQVTGVLRGQGGTTAQTHLANTLVEMNLTAEDLEDAINVPNDVVTRFGESLGDFIASGLVWSGDAYGSTRNASMTAGIVYINGARIPVALVAARTFTASRDTYIDVGDDGVVDYTEVATNAASPALATNHIRVAIIITGVSSIANVAAINQGQTNKLLPKVSNAYLAVCDSLGNLIANRVAQPVFAAFRRQSAAQSGITTETDMTGQSAMVNVPEGKSVKITLMNTLASTVANDRSGLAIYEDGVLVQQSYLMHPTTQSSSAMVAGFSTPSAGVHTYKGRASRISGSGTIILDTTAYMSVELV